MEGFKFLTSKEVELEIKDLREKNPKLRIMRLSVDSRGWNED